MHRHSHGDGHDHSHGESDSRALRSAMWLTLGFFGVELVGGWWTNSLALMSDAVHMFSDVAALGLGVFALWMAGRSPTDSKTYGYYRAEILGALMNGLGLWLVVAWIAYEAVFRLASPAEVKSSAMGVVALLGLGVNAICAYLLSGSSDSLNMRAAYLHVIGDLLGSVGALVAAVVMATTGWYGADAVASLFICVLIVASSWGLIRESVDILMEAVPSHVDLDEVRAAMQTVHGAEKVHDLHVWTLTTGQYALSAHAVVAPQSDGDVVLESMREVLCARFNIDHVTIQLERSNPCEPDSVHL